MDRTITVIVPTLALAQRAALIMRAIDSVVRQESVTALPLLVVNGPQADPLLVRELAGRRDVRVIKLSAPDLPAALRAGRATVETAWFAELDDDDVLLPNALAQRLERLERDDTLDAVVSNGIIRGDGRERPAIDDVARVASDPLAALAAGNWLCPGAALFRSATVPVEMFADVPQYLEWTYLAATLALTRKLDFLEERTFVHYTDSPSGVWASDRCELGLPTALQRLLGLDLPPALRGSFARRLTAAYNRAAHADLRAGRLREAWRSHLRCLGGADGWRYLPFTRKLLQVRVRSGAAET